MTQTATEPRTVEFFFDPACPFCWQTAKWLRQVARQTDIQPTWRFISLAVLNDEMDDLDSAKGHTVGHKMLRVAAAAEAAHGSDLIGALYEEMGRRLWETAPDLEGPVEDEAKREASAEHFQSQLAALPQILETVGLPGDLAAAAEDSSWDEQLRASTDEAMERTGGNVGTPILAWGQAAFFGPVISSTPSDEDAVKLWDAVETMTTFDGFAELKRSLRDPLDNGLLRTLDGR